MSNEETKEAQKAILSERSEGDNRVYMTMLLSKLPLAMLPKLEACLKRENREGADDNIMQSAAIVASHQMQWCIAQVTNNIRNVHLIFK